MATGIPSNSGVLNNVDVRFLDSITEIIASSPATSGITVFVEPVSGRRYLQYGADGANLSAAGKAAILKLFGYDPAYGSPEPYNYGDGDKLPNNPRFNALGGVAYKDQANNAYGALVFPSRANDGSTVDEIAAQELTHHFLSGQIPTLENEIAGDAVSLLLNGNYVNYLLVFNAADVLGQQNSGISIPPRYRGTLNVMQTYLGRLAAAAGLSIPAKPGSAAPAEIDVGRALINDLIKATTDAAGNTDYTKIDAQFVANYFATKLNFTKINSLPFVEGFIKSAQDIFTGVARTFIPPPIQPVTVDPYPDLPALTGPIAINDPAPESVRITGTSGNDRVFIRQVDANTVSVELNGTTTNYAATNRLSVDLGEGDDTFVVAEGVSPFLSLIVEGDQGNDIILYNNETNGSYLTLGSEGSDLVIGRDNKRTAVNSTSKAIDLAAGDSIASIIGDPGNPIYAALSGAQLAQAYIASTEGALTPARKAELAALPLPPPGQSLEWAIANANSSGAYKANAQSYLTAFTQNVTAGKGVRDAMLLATAGYKADRVLVASLNGAGIGLAGIGFDARPAPAKFQLTTDYAAYTTQRASTGKPAATEQQRAAFRDSYLEAYANGGTLTQAYAAGKTAADGLDLIILAKGDDNSSDRIDISGIFENGIKIGGETYTGLYINNNGNVTFKNSLSTYTPTGIGSTGNPMIAPFWADVDTRSAGEVSYQFDSAQDAMIVTWTDVGYFSNGSDKKNSFQLKLVDKGDGNFDAVFIYNKVEWTTGNASQGSGGLGGTVARAGVNDGVNPALEIAGSSDQASILALEDSVGSTGAVGVSAFSFVNGTPALRTNATEETVLANGDTRRVTTQGGFVIETIVSDTGANDQPWASVTTRRDITTGQIASVVIVDDSGIKTTQTYAAGVLASVTRTNLDGTVVAINPNGQIIA